MVKQKNAGRRNKGDNRKSLSGRSRVDLSISAHDYPSLGLGDKEYVVIDLERSRIGLAFIWAIVIVMSFFIMLFCQTIIWSMNRLEINFLVVLLGYLAVFFAIILGLVESRIYKRNYMIITNQRVFTRTQIGPFATKTRVIELSNIEDIGVYRKGILPTIFSYGEIRLSTELDDLTYKITFVKNPDRQAVAIEKIVNAID